MSTSFEQCVNEDNIKTCLTRTSSVGLAFVTESGFISLSSIILLTALLVRNVLRCRKEYPGHKWNLIQKPADVYVLSLLLADAFQAVGAVMNVRWVHNGIVQIGTFCTVQGAIKQIGDTSVALATMTIALQTLASVWFRKGIYRLRFAFLIVAVSWIFIGTFVIAATTTQKNYYTPTPFVCWVGSGYGKERLAGEYVWLWLALFVSVVTYVPLALWRRGNLVIDTEKWWKMSFRWRRSTIPGESKETRSRSSIALLAYPVAYFIIVLPISVVRWITFSEEARSHNANQGTPPAAYFATAFLHDLFGFVNVVLLVTTRPNLLLLDWRRPHGREPYPYGRLSGTYSVKRPGSVVSGGIVTGGPGFIGGGSGRVSPDDDDDDNEWENKYRNVNGNELGYVRHNGHAAAIKMSIAVAHTPTSRSVSPSTLSTSSYAIGESTTNKHLNTYSNIQHQYHRRRSSSSYIHSSSYSSPTDSMVPGLVGLSSGLEGRGAGNQIMSNARGVSPILSMTTTQNMIAPTVVAASTRPSVDPSAVYPDKNHVFDDFMIDNSPKPDSNGYGQRDASDTQRSNLTGSGPAIDWTLGSSRIENRISTTTTASSEHIHVPTLSQATIQTPEETHIPSSSRIFN